MPPPRRGHGAEARQVRARCQARDEDFCRRRAGRMTAPTFAVEKYRAMIFDKLFAGQDSALRVHHLQNSACIVTSLFEPASRRASRHSLRRYLSNCSRVYQPLFIFVILVTEAAVATFTLDISPAPPVK